VSKPLDAGRPRVRGDRIAIQREFENVVRLHKSRAQRTRQQITARIAGMTQADVPVFVKEALPDQNAIGDRELVLGAL
jgi:hypothetical protein